MHAVQVPELQTMLLPHAVPFARAVPVSVQAEAPVEHDVSPVWHALLGVHARPAVQAAHAPLLQTMLAPQAVPFGAFDAVSTQLGVALHDVVPVWQTLTGTHATPGVHEVQAPLLQTSLVPHGVPSATGVAVSLHWEVPPAQPSAPL